MHRTARVLATTAVLALLAGGCGASDDPSPGGEPGDEVDGGDVGDEVDGGLDGTVDGTDAEEPTDDGEAAVTLEGATEVAVADLAATTGVDEAEIEVISAEEVTWSDGALGCPEPGEMYTQALVPGYRIVLGTDGDEVAYHGADGTPPFRCDDPSPPADAGT